MPSKGSSGDTVSRPGVASSFGDIIAAERGRWILWLPVLMGLGIGTYFALPVEPPLWIGVGTVAGLAVALWLTRRCDGPWIVCIGLTTVAISVWSAEIRTRVVAAPVLIDEIWPVSIQGRVVAIEGLQRGSRVTLDSLVIPRLATAAHPAQARISIPTPPPHLKPGDRIRVSAMLSPPPGPAAPGAHDFHRQFFFDGLGAVGFAVGTATVIAPRPADAGGSFALWLEILRQRINERILAVQPGASSVIAAAFMTGDRGPIPEDILAAMRDSGLAHLLAIYGESDALGIRCDNYGCIYRANGHVVAFVRDIAALSDDCGRADVVVSTVPVRRRCPSAKAVVDRFDLWRNGAHAIWLGEGPEDDIRIESANASRGDRPWVVRPDRITRGFSTGG
ncbi:MAG: ComEC family DNA internalization-related competence protein [Rhodospirillales bacterium]|nr:ComEC family DNA internalization-related competence protein [Rhodospirillales bacterium]